MPMMNKPKTHASNTRFSPTSFLKRFAQDEDGSVLIMTILLLVTMLIVGGMAVDFMRFESRRAEIQGVADRAVLSAANLNQTISPEEIVIDHFEKAGYADSLVDIPIANVTAIERTVQVDAQVDVNTFFLRLAGIDQLSAPAFSRAVEGAGEVEVSLILDISGSMGTVAQDTREYETQDSENSGACTDRGLTPEAVWKSTWWGGSYISHYQCVVAGRTFTRLDLLKTAAANFTNTILGVNGNPSAGNYSPTVSMSLVNYTAQVNIGDELFDAIKTNVTRTADPNGIHPDFVNPSRCIDFLSTEYNTTVFNADRTYDQFEYFDDSSRGEEVSNPSCPQESFEAIVALADQAGDANTPGTILGNIANLQPRRTTSIHIGMKWGVSLLDPSMQTTVDDLASVHSNFRGSRPLDYAEEDERPTVKYVVLMTDGENYAGRRTKPGGYDSFYEQYALFQHPVRFLQDVANEPGNSASFDWNSNDFGWSDIFHTPYQASQYDTWLSQTCNKAREADIIIYTIAMDAPEAGQKAMEDCASKPTSRFYKNTEGSAIDSIFQDIATQITDLRLNL